MTLALTGLLLVLVTQTVAWALATVRRDVSLADVCWGLQFVLLAWVYAWLAGAWTPRAGLVVAFVTLWGVRLAVHILRRHLGQSEDPRYQAMRARRGPAFWWRSLFVVFWLQGLLAWIVAWPVLAAVSATGPEFVAPLDLIGAAVFVIGFAFEAVGDHQLARFRADPANRGRVLDRGLWHYTRHPNYFGDALLWWGLYLVAAATPAGWLTAFGPVVMTFLLMRVSGVPLLESGLTASKPGYADYRARTPAFFPWRPRRAPSRG